MPELVVLLAALLLAGAFILAPLRRRAAATSAERGTEVQDREALAERHRVALEALRDVEADRRLGSLDGETYAAERAAAEVRVAHARAALEAADATADAPEASDGERRVGGRDARRAATLVAGLVAVALLAAMVVPAPVGVANVTIHDEAAAAAAEAEAARQARIGELAEAVTESPHDVDLLLQLADAYLAGETRRDLVLGATVLAAAISVDSRSEAAHEKIITAYLRAGDYPNARAALDAYAALDPPPAEVAFFTGIVALRGESDFVAARDAFDEFLRLAPDDERAAMVRALRAEAEAAIGP
jgi:tetratricopeptide (TPR) repeat protein